MVPTGSVTCAPVRLRTPLGDSDKRYQVPAAPSPFSHSALRVPNEQCVCARARSVICWNSARTPVRNRRAVARVHVPLSAGKFPLRSCYDVLPLHFCSGISRSSPTEENAFGLTVECHRSETKVHKKNREYRLRAPPAHLPLTCPGLNVRVAEAHARLLVAQAPLTTLPLMHHLLHRPLTC